jgi:Domain of unknown function (DUF4386)
VNHSNLAETQEETLQVAEASPRPKARFAGGLYLLIIAGGLFAVGYVPAAIVVHGDAAATAHNLLANESLYRLGLAVHVIIALCNVPLAVIFYDLFKAANRSLAGVLVLFILVGVAIESVNLLNEFAPLVLLRGEHYAGVISAEQLQAQAHMPLELQNVGFNLSLAFVGCYCLVAGCLIFRSRLLPQAIGVLLAIGGLCYVFNSFAYFLAPDFAAGLFPFIQLPSFIGELSLCLWLLIKGVNVERWEELVREPV